jgi:Flp pilus assembly protein TadG
MSLGRKRRPLLSSQGPRRVPAEERGAEIVEFAIVFPALCMLLIGMIWMGRAYNIYETMTRAAREGSRILVLTNCTTCGNVPLTAASVRTNFVEPVLTSDFLDPTKVSGYTSTYVWLDPNATPPQQCGVAISFSYPVKLVIPFTSLNASTISISTKVQMRMENQPTTCSAGSAVP